VVRRGVINHALLGTVGVVVVRRGVINHALPSRPRLAISTRRVASHQYFPRDTLYSLFCNVDKRET